MPQILQVSPIDTLVGNNNSSIRFDVERLSMANRDANFSNERCPDPESPIKEDLLDLCKDSSSSAAMPNGIRTRDGTGNKDLDDLVQHPPLSGALRVETEESPGPPASSVELTENHPPISLHSFAPFG